MFWHLVFNLTRQRALYLDQNPILCDSICGPTEEWILGVLHESNLVRFLAVALVINITSDGFQESPVCSGCVTGPCRLEHLFAQEIIGPLIVIVTNGARHVTGREHRLAERQPLGTALVRIRSPQ